MKIRMMFWSSTEWWWWKWWFEIILGLLLSDIVINPICEAPKQEIEKMGGEKLT